MAINRDALSELLEPLIVGRDDSADVLEAILALDVEPDSPSVEEVTAQAVAEALAEAKKEFNARFESAFFAKSAAQGETDAEVIEDGDNDIPSNPTITDLLTSEER